MKYTLIFFLVIIIVVIAYKTIVITSIVAGVILLVPNKDLQGDVVYFGGPNGAISDPTAARRETFASQNPSNTHTPHERNAEERRTTSATKDGARFESPPSRTKLEASV